MIFRSLFANDGFINTVLRGLGMSPIMWFSNAWTARAVIIIALIWRWTGYNMVFYLSGMQNIEYSIYEAAKIDGCNDMGVFIKIVIPASLPIIATIMLFNAVGQWNTWMDAYLYVKDQNLMPLQTILQRILNQAEAQQTLKDLALGADVAAQRITPQAVQLATMVVSIGPIVAVYPFFQKYFVKGFLIGAVKE